MEYSKEKVDEVVLALLYLNLFNDGAVSRAWKSFDWDAMNRLYENGLISNPQSKAKSVVMFEEGIKKAESLFRQYFEKH